MDKEFKKWMKWYGKKHGEYTVSSPKKLAFTAAKGGFSMFSILDITCICSGI